MSAVGREVRFDDDYIAWAQLHLGHPIAHDLGSSGLAIAWDWSEWDVDLSALPAEGSDWYGDTALRESLAAALGVVPERVLATPGCTGANALVMAAWVGPGDRVAVETPAYSPPATVARGFGAEIVPLPRDAARGWGFDPAALAPALEGCALCFVTNPHNPTGHCMDQAEIDTLAAACARAGAVLVVDEVYREFPDAAHLPSAVHAGDHVVVTSSVTKAYGLGGLRVGWIAASEEAIARCIAVNRTLLGRGSVPGEWLVGRLLADADRWEAFRAEIAERVAGGRALAETFIAARPELSWQPPGAGIVGLVDVVGEADGRAFAARAWREAGVYLVPGEFLGAPGHVRLSFGGGIEAVAAGLERLATLFDLRA